MTLSRRMTVLILALILGAGGLEVGERLDIPGIRGYVLPAEAIVGRPLTPVSVAGVARRSVRRCAVGVYYC